MRFSQDFIEKVQEANNLVDIISQYTQLKPMAGGYMGRCPFPDHQERTASFSVSETKQVYNCFGCHKKGNIFTFLQQFNGMNFPEAIEFLANRAHLSIPMESIEESDRHDQASKKKKEIAAANRWAMSYFSEQFRRLSPQHPAKIYALEKRKLSPEIIQDFHVGYSTEDWDGLVQFLASKGVSPQISEEARLVKARKEGNGHFDLFRERLMFPILNTMNEPIAFGGRIILQGEPKYLNSPETLLFHKSKTLYGLHQTARYIRSEDQAIIVEGYMDLVALYQVGIKNVAATMGTALTADHGRMLSRMTKNIVVLFDGDSAGIEAAERSLPILLAADVHPKGLILPNGQDPDDFVNSHGAEALQNLISVSRDLYYLVLAKWMENYRGEASEKVKLADKLQPVFESIADQRLLQLYLQETAQKMSVDEYWLKKALMSKPQSRYQNRQEEPPKSSPVNNFASQQSSPANLVPTQGASADHFILKGASKAEAMLLGLVLQNKANWDRFWQTEGAEWVTHKGVKGLLMKASAICGQHPEKFDKLAGLLTSFVDMPEVILANSAVDGGVTEASDESGAEREAKLLTDCLRRLQDQHLKAKTDLLSKELKLQSTPEKLEQFMNIQRDRRALTKETK
jgi:DNA primase